MVEVTDKETNQKLMAMIVCGICYKKDCYIIYCIRREKEEVNLFISKLIQSSQGYVMDNNFSNGEKKVLDDMVQRLLNMESKEQLGKDGISILKDIVLTDNHYFDIEKCYVSTVPRKLIKNCLVYYQLLNEKMLEPPVVEVVDDRRIFSEGFASNLALIFLGVAVLVFSLIFIWNVFVG